MDQPTTTSFSYKRSQEPKNTSGSAKIEDTKPSELENSKPSEVGGTKPLKVEDIKSPKLEDAKPSKDSKETTDSPHRPPPSSSGKPTDTEDKDDEKKKKGLKPQTVETSLRFMDDVQFFLATAPANWQENQIIRRYYLSHDEGFVSCVFWSNLYFVTGTDIVKSLIYRFEQFGRAITDRKKFEEGVFSDLRNLKCGTDAVLEPPKSKFLEFLYKNSCLRTQKKQKVFFWFSVQHDKLFSDALERDLKREILDQKTTTEAQREPALSFKYDDDDSKPLFDQFTKHIQDIKRSLGIASPDPVVTGTTTTTTTTTDISAAGQPLQPQLSIRDHPYNYIHANQQMPLPHGYPQLQYPQQLMPQNVSAAGFGGALSQPLPLDQEQQASVLGALTSEGPQSNYITTEDDFPLDFFPQNDYISETIDPSQAFMTNSVPLFDPNIFLNPNLISGGSADPNMGMGNDFATTEFLIDSASPFSPAHGLVEDDLKDEEENLTEIKLEDGTTVAAAAAAAAIPTTATQYDISDLGAHSTVQAAGHPARMIPGTEMISPLYNPLYQSSMNQQLAFASQAQLMNPLMAPGSEFFVNPYLADPGLMATAGNYYDHMSALQAQQQMMTMMNPALMGAGGFAPPATASAINQLQRQKLMQQGAVNGLMTMVRQQRSQNPGRVEKPGNNISKDKESEKTIVKKEDQD
ncbi:homeodomain family transcription factor [Saccharomycopsis crataegensis]|uniref:Homeodomain family transcription factor n=1 Tax=Saccharomycopsis crataegensis TaxID=43959 RepID=A0AAV5QUX8_9ASCO|nr:homeodomain family transcription factor [Saccharomycopsis crataegensis]